MKSIIFTLTLFISVTSYAQKINQEDLYTIWLLDKYSDEEEYYLPPKKEVGDSLAFKQDMTYTAVFEGKKSNGTWLLNTNGKYIELLSDQGEREKLYIHFLSNKSMVVTYDTDEFRIWEVHYVSRVIEGE
ncbi:hypothetical protein QQ020_13255 [Fulvivirgaceae bacterium BMA12]|uniref:Lipocalin-like domain-containing protein n=1 Tax=Agaribacillus aureus TaxID=3051825 RepID=A0ABT8L5M6_9BACT|nr:hypothetical protein [Fulvivirgaceae bacterium BMA12]